MKPMNHRHSMGSNAPARRERTLSRPPGGKPVLAPAAISDRQGFRGTQWCHPVSSLMPAMDIKSVPVGKRSPKRALSRKPIRAGYSIQGIPGVRLASSLYYQPDVTQGAGDALNGDDVSALLWTSSLDANYKGFGLRALHANWSLDGAEVDLTGRDKQSGFLYRTEFRS